MCWLRGLEWILLGMALARTGEAHSAGVFGSGVWETLAPMPSARQEVGVGELSGFIYVVAGFDSSNRSTHFVERYDPQSDVWAATAPLPATEELNHVGVASAGGRLYSIGGLRQNFRAVPWVFSYDPNANEWREEPPLPRARGACGVAVIDDVLYVAGGQDGSITYRDFASYNPASREWSVLPDMPTARNHLAGVSIDGLFYAVSGRNGSGLQNANEVYLPESQSWSAAAPIPTPRGGIAGASLAGRIYIFGGEGNPNHPDGVFEEVEEYNPETNSWRGLQPMPAPRHGIGAAAVGGRIFIPGGGPIQGFSQTDRNDAFRPPRFPSALWRAR